MVETRPRALPPRPDTPAGRLRHRVTEANLLRHVSGPQRVLDVAGGGGSEAVRLALAGHEVTVLDPAGAMLCSAKARAEEQGVSDRVHIVQAAAEDAPELFGEHDFDVALCHNLVHFADDRMALLRALAAPVREGGLLSVLAPNPAAAPLYAALKRHDIARALAEVDADACTADDVRADLAAVGADVIAHYGVSCVAGYLPAEELTAEVEELELALSTRQPYVLTARYFHLVARV
ncbi:putative S-adenosyl-L-methionine-dependent methyltransferase [Actinokineospora sp. UTMC 2448]|nr:putative S-adenosyl-L-methionine-dependent methyltransferase [Actinokineospora sp. UTMC 2448]